jgi:hypothetical protein
MTGVVAAHALMRIVIPNEISKLKIHVEAF